MRTIAFLLVLLALAAPAFCDIWSNCGTSSDHFQIGAVSIVPDPPVKGQNLNVTASGTLDESVTSGNVHVLVKYGFITLINQNEDLCNSENPIPCPIAAGDYTRSVVAAIPSNAPSGKYTGNVVITDQNNQQIACINVAFSL